MMTSQKADGKKCKNRLTPLRMLQLNRMFLHLDSHENQTGSIYHYSGPEDGQMHVLPAADDVLCEGVVESGPGAPASCECGVGRVGGVDLVEVLEQHLARLVVTVCPRELAVYVQVQLLGDRTVFLPAPHQPVEAGVEEQAFRTLKKQ